MPTKVMNISNLPSTDLLNLHAQIAEELRERKVLRSANNPTGDLAEHLFCKAYNWSQAPNSERGYDATDDNGTRYQIKGRRLHKRNKSRQLSAIRQLESRHFDFLAGVLFDESYGVFRAMIAPYSIVEECSTYVSHTNSHKFILRDAIWDISEVTDVTENLRAVTL